MIQHVQLAQQQVRLQVLRLQPGDRLILLDRRAQHLLRLRSLLRLLRLPVVQRPEVHPPQQRMGIDIVRVLGNLLLRRAHRLTDAPQPEVDIRQTVLQHCRIRVRAQRQLVLLDRLRRQILALRCLKLVLINLGQPEVVVRRRPVLPRIGSLHGIRRLGRRLCWRTGLGGAGKTRYGQQCTREPGERSAKRKGHEWDPETKHYQNIG